MEIHSTLTSFSGGVFNIFYAEDKDPNQDLEGKILHGAHAHCFYGDKLVIVCAEKNKRWGPPGGHIEDGETWQEATIREIKEEANMKVLHHELIGYQDVFQKNETVRQTRSFCIVEPFGEFVSDPDGDICEIKLIDPADYRQYFDWGEIGERIMQRALELNEKYKNNHER